MTSWLSTPRWRRAYNQEPDLCWECYSCVKTCPQGAIEMRGYADVMPMGSRVTPLRGTDSIMWAIQYRNGDVKRFKYPIRTTAWGSINPDVDLPDRPPRIPAPASCWPASRSTSSSTPCPP